MKYVRTKDGRIIEKCNLDPRYKQSVITIMDKKYNKVLRQIICDDLDDYLDIVVGEYCKFNKINPKDIKWETKILLNDILSQADTIEELIQDDDLALWFKIKVYCDDYYYEYLTENVLMSVKDAKTIASMGYSGHFNLKDIKELYIKDKYGNYIKIAERKDEKGELELL